MIPQRSSQQLSAEQVQKQREYLKQQQKLRLMASSSTQKTVSADTLINNLLEKKDTFRPADSIPSNLPSTSRERTPEGVKAAVPVNQQVSIEWLSPTSPNFPAVYRRIWTMVGQPDGLVDTGKVFPLLLTSGLPTEVLGYIWGLVNQTVAGRLTEQELYSLLALVALAQRGYSFNSANVLSLVPQPPLPNLNLGTEPQPANKMRREDLNLQAHPQISQPSVPQLHSVPHLQPSIPQLQPSVPQLNPVQLTAASVFRSDTTADLDDFDDFADFQSATLVTSNSLNSKDLNIPVKIAALPQQQNMDLAVQSQPATPSFDIMTPPEPVFVQKFPTVAVVGGGRSIGSRLANHSLGAPKTNKPKHHKHHHHHHHRNVPPMPLAVADDDFSDFQQASSEEVFPKCAIKPPPTHTYLLKESAIRSEDLKSVGNILNNSSKVANISTEIYSDIKVETESTAMEPANVEKGSELMGVEDRYGALRALSFASEEPAETGSASNFSDFFSASASSADDSFADISTRTHPSSQGLAVANEMPWPTTAVDSTDTAEFTVDDWGDFESVSNSIPDIKQSVGLNSAPSQSQGKDIWGKNSLLMDDLSGCMTDTNLGLHNLITPLQSTTELTTENSEKVAIFNISPINSQKPSVVSSSSNIVSNNSINDEDDFGDFVGTDTWVEEDKQRNESLWTEVKEADAQSVGNLWLDDTKVIDEQWLEDDGNKTPKEEVFSNHLVSTLWLKESKALDTQSVSSLELPGLEQAWDTVGEWRKCLQACVPVFQFALTTFNAVDEPNVLQEVMGSSRGQDYLRDLKEVWSVCERIATSYRQMGMDHKLDSLLLNVESAWESLKVHYSRAQVPVESTSVLDGPETCCICLLAGAKLEFEGHTYHAPCANVWLHFVDTVLPILQA